MSDTMEEGVIAAWLKKVGDDVKAGDILAEVETDKATMELESYDEGVLLHIGVEEKDAVPVNGVIAIIGEKGEDIDDLLKDLDGGGSGDADAAKSEAPAEDKKEESSSEADPSEEIDTSDINANLITMPKMSDTMQEGTIASWLKKEGDEVKSGDILAEVETDKATMELESYDDGVLLHIGVQEGDSVPIDGVIAVIGEKGADYEKLLKAHEQKSNGGSDEKPAAKEEEKKEAPKEASKPAPKKEETAKQTTSSSSASSDNGRIKASPLAKKLAEDKGVDIALIKGSGEGGRIIKRDVESFDPASVDRKSVV